MQPLLYPTALRKKNIRVRSFFLFLNQDIAYLSKYCPKFCKELDLGRHYGKRMVQSRVKQLKIVRHYYCDGYSSSDERTLKRLFQNNRKTLKSLPTISIPDGGGSFQHFSLCMYFPRIKTLNLEKQRFSNYSQCDIELQKRIFRSFGHFWSSSRFVEDLKVGCYNDLDLIIIKKLDGSKRFLSSLKTLEFQISANMSIQSSRNLLTNKDFLRHVTRLRIGEFGESTKDH